MTRVITRAFLVLALWAPDLDAQPGSNAATMGRALQGNDVLNDPRLAEAINEILSDTNAHMRMAPTRRATPEDSARAAAVVTLARAALAKYKDVKRAEADGFLRFLPNVEPQSIYHYTNYEHAVAAMYVLDPRMPTSLLYRKNAAGTMVLVGVMYTAPWDATPEELDGRLPLGMAHWHEHVNFCSPGREALRSGQWRRDGAAIARWLRITTREACESAGGRFVPRLFGWMTHAYIFAGDDPKVIWGGEGKGHMHP
jgi:hypothetical protein